MNFKVFFSRLQRAKRLNRELARSIELQRVLNELESENSSNRH